MTRKRLLMVMGGFVVAIAAAVGCVAWLALQVPEFYERALAETKDPTGRRQAAKRFVQNTTRLADDIQQTDRWSQEFSQTQVNGWLAEDVPRQHRDRLPPGVSDPRVQITPEAIRLGFRYYQDGYSGVVSLQLRPWLVEDNRLAIEVRGVRAGYLPIPVDEALHNAARQLDRQGWRVEWSQHDGNDVCIIDLNRHGQPAVAVLNGVELGDGLVRLSGHRRASDEAPAESIAAESAAEPMSPVAAGRAEGAAVEDPSPSSE